MNLIKKQVLWKRFKQFNQGQNREHLMGHQMREEELLRQISQSILI